MILGKRFEADDAMMIWKNITPNWGAKKKNRIQKIAGRIWCQDFVGWVFVALNLALGCCHRDSQAILVDSQGSLGFQL